jgi:hypothetical protein
MTFLELAAVCAIGYLASEIYDSSMVAAACATCFFAYKFYDLLVVAASCRRALFDVYRRIGASVIPASRGAGFLRHVARLGAGYSSGVIGDGPPEALRRWLTPTSAAATVSVTFCAQPRLALPNPAPVRLDVPARAMVLLESTLMAAAALALAEPPVRRVENSPPRVPPPQSRAERGAAHVTQVAQTGAERPPTTAWATAQTERPRRPRR